jgi:tRNA (guanine26-N2/guanine27-N2)-dimethyltransferase
MITEEGTNFEVCKNVFYNPNMKFCRSLLSLAVGAIDKRLVLCDGFAATGIRGIRYAKENENVSEVVFVDIEDDAVKCIRKNVRMNKIRAKIMKGNISRLVFDIVADFVEVDPFGTPSPYLYDVFRMFNPLKSGYLSVTATDTAVLCGGRVKAAMKNYHSKPLNNEFTHENGLRILVKKIAEVAAEFNFGIKPFLSISDRHYLKTLVYLERSAEKADQSLKQLKYVVYCENCSYRETVKFPYERCPNCKSQIDYAGPLWAGELHEQVFIRKMIALNEKRNYSQKAELAKKLAIMESEVGMPPYFYDIHYLSKKLHLERVPKIDEIIERGKTELKTKIVRTHFSPTAIKTSARPEEVITLLKR